MPRLATALICLFLLSGAVAASAEPAAAPVLAPASPTEPLFLAGSTCLENQTNAAKLPIGANYCGECALDSHCTTICGGWGNCAPAPYNPRCGVCMCA